MNNNNNSKQNSLSPTKQALLALDKIQSKLNAVEYANNEPIAIIGTGCRFPGGIDNPETFWRILRDGVDTISEVPKNRWDANFYYDSDPNVIDKICRDYYWKLVGKL